MVCIWHGQSWLTEYLLWREVSVIEGSEVHSCLYDKNVYSYFEKGCRKKCTRQSRKVLWVVLSSLFFKEIWKDGTRSRGRVFAGAEGKQLKEVLTATGSGTAYWSYSILPFGIVPCTFLPTTFLEIAIYTCIMMQNRLLYALMTQYKSLYDLKILEKLFLE